MARTAPVVVLVCVFLMVSIVYLMWASGCMSAQRVCMAMLMRPVLTSSFRSATRAIVVRRVQYANESFLIRWLSFAVNGCRPSSTSHMNSAGTLAMLVAVWAV